MRKIFKTMFLVLLGVFLVSGSAYAISGQCSNCHTMHNSQNGLGEVKTYSDGSLTTGVTTPQDNLLKASCIACHAGSTGKTDAITFAPIVVHTTAPTGQGNGKTNAGGDFYWVAKGLGADNTKGHNVSGLADADSTINMTAGPPGWDPTATSGFAYSQVAGGTWTNEQVTCDGTFGCHGRHTSEGIKGAHHSNTGGTHTVASAPSDVGDSYRFLGGIKGLEDTDWNWNETATNHNEYYGADRAGETYVPKETISFSCAECHGNFHLDISSASFATPWIRHPTDIKLGRGAGTEYSAYNPDTGGGSTQPRTYSMEAPVARGAVPTSPSQDVYANNTNETGAIVMCLSCHRAHGSPEPDILRWTYTGIIAGSGTTDNGCFNCHTTKNGDVLN